ncbi:MAG TPA: DNA-3-methyladenine glycosylase I, partial [Actinomycetota bacterium]|nr:DNA-3-methyladenine glycosylase I [Actinomycetota bacterium]
GLGDLAASTPQSKALSKELLRRGFHFVGPTTVYAAMQSLGIVNDHVAWCFARAECEEARAALRRPVGRG